MMLLLAYLPLVDNLKKHMSLSLSFLQVVDNLLMECEDDPLLEERIYCTSRKDSIENASVHFTTL